MKNSPFYSLRVVWRLLTWLLPLACLIPLTNLAAEAIGATFLPGSDQWRTIGLVFALVFASAQILYLAGGIAAAILAWRGGDRTAVVVLATVSAAALSAVPPFGWYDFYPGSNLLLAVPGIVAAGLAILGLPLLRRGPVVALVLALALLAIPSFNVVRTQIDKEQYFANDCPPGPSMDLVLSGAAAGHYTVACALPKSGNELTRCGPSTAEVGFFTGQTVWSLEVPRAPAGVTVVSAQPARTPSLVMPNTIYGGPSGWSGSYTFDSECSGQIDADLFSGLSGGHPVHVTGHFATVRAASP